MITCKPALDPFSWFRLRYRQRQVGNVELRVVPSWADTDSYASWIQEKCGVTFQNETRDGRLVSIKTRFPLQNLGWFMKLLLKKRRMCLWVIMGLTLQSSLLCCHMISFIFNHSFISYHILSFYVQISLHTNRGIGMTFLTKLGGVSVVMPVCETI